MPNRNWPAIAEIKDYHFRVAVSLTTEVEILEGLAKGFPELFMAGDDQGPLRIPLSALMEAARKFSVEQHPDEPHFWEEDRHFTLSWASQYHAQLDVPVAFHWGTDGTDLEPPPEVLQQLIGQKAQAGMQVSYGDRRYVILNLTFRDEVPEIGSELKELPNVGDIQLVEAEFIALDK